MKKILISASLLIAVVTLSANAKSMAATESKVVRIINVTIEGWVLLATSSGSSGNIQTIDIYSLPGNTLVRTQDFDSDICTMKLTGLPSGAYEAVVTSTNDSHSVAFKL